jgi:uncharacterized membrane protein YfcA
MALDPAYVVAGLLVGVLVGLTGVGGGSLMTPLLILVFGMHPSTAVGTDLVFASGTKLVGTAMHQAWRGIAWRIVGLLAAGSMPAAAVTLVALNALGGRGPLITAIVSLTLAVALLLTAALLALRDTILRRLEQRAQTAATAYSPLLTVAVGAVVGVLVSLSSVGAGALGTVALLLLYPRLPLVRVVGTDIAHAVPLTLVAGLGHAWLGSFNGAILMPLLVGSIPGIILGSLAARIAPERVMRGVLAAVLVVVAGQIGKSVLL